MEHFFKNPITIYVASVVVSALICHKPVVWFLKATKFLKEHHGDGPNFSLWVGILERAVVTMLVLGGATSTTVFIFVAKTAIVTFRAPEGPQRKEIAEYVIVGTLISYALALAVGTLGWYLTQEFRG